MSPGTGGACSYSQNFFTITNGYANNAYGISTTTMQAISGGYIDYVCMAPYIISGNSRMTCTNGVWSAQPTCIGNLSK